MKKLVGIMLLALSIPAYAGLDDFNEPSYDNKMVCYNNHHARWVVIARKGDTIVQWLRSNPYPKNEIKILESDHKTQRYFAVVDTIIGRQENLFDFQKRVWKGKSSIGSFSYDCR